MQIHVRGSVGDVAPAVLLPGDPDRARLIAERYLQDARQYTARRGLPGYSGTWQGRPVSVQATGMGGPSAAIVVEELCRLGAETFLRIGTCGALQPEIALGDLVTVTAASAFDGTSRTLAMIDGYAPVSDWSLTADIARAARSRSGRNCHIGPVASMDLFYDPRTDVDARLRALSILAIEMEAASVFTVAARNRRRAGCLLAVSDIIEGHVRAGDSVLDEAVAAMIEVALTALAGPEKEA